MSWFVVFPATFSQIESTKSSLPSPKLPKEEDLLKEGLNLLQQHVVAVEKWHEALRNASTLVEDLVDFLRSDAKVRLFPEPGTVIGAVLQLKPSTSLLKSTYRYDDIDLMVAIFGQLQQIATTANHVHKVKLAFLLLLLFYFEKL